MAGMERNLLLPTLTYTLASFALDFVSCLLSPPPHSTNGWLRTPLPTSLNSDSVGGVSHSEWAVFLTTMHPFTLPFQRKPSSSESVTIDTLIYPHQSIFFSQSLSLCFSASLQVASRVREASLFLPPSPLCVSTLPLQYQVSRETQPHSPSRCQHDKITLLISS